MTKSTLIKSAFSHRASHSAFNPFMWLLTMKVVFCIMLGLRRELADTEKLSECIGIVDLHHIAWHHDPNVFGWKEIRVSKGFHFYYDLVPNATPEGVVND